MDESLTMDHQVFAMDKLLKNKKALITGGTAGIGRAIAELFAECGAHVTIVGTNVERGEEILKVLHEKAKDATREFKFACLDVSNGEKVKEFCAQIFEIDILVNNAGIVRDKMLLRMDEADWDAVIETNLKSVYRCCQGVLRTMLKQKSGSIINLSSIVGLRGNAGQTNYAASKAGVIGFTLALAKEVGSRGIRVNCIAPGFIQTNMTAALNDAQKENLIQGISLKRLGVPRDVAHAALYLASDMASYVTGQVLVVDGGMQI